MLMNCEMLDHWTKQVVETQTGAYLHRFEDIPDEQIGKIPDTWNVLDEMDETTRLIHYTNGGPWYEEYQDHLHAGVWYTARNEMNMAQNFPAPHITALPDSKLIGGDTSAAMSYWPRSTVADGDITTDIVAGRFIARTIEISAES